MTSQEYRLLDEMALRSGTDKSSHWHDYMHAYARHFAPFKHLPICFLEIGLWKGYSAKLWENYFEKAELHFIDISFDAIEYRGHSHYHLCNQEDPEDLKCFLEKVPGPFDIIVDDGNHSARGQLTSFAHLFPRISSGGLYVIEDLHSSYWGGIGPGSTMHFLKSLIDEVNFIGARTGRASQASIASEVRPEMTFFRDQIRSISFSSSMAVIERR